MTIITKAISEKKPGDKLEQPLVVLSVPNNNGANTDPESVQQYPNNDYVIRKRFLIIGGNKRLSSGITTYCLFLTGLLVTMIGIFGGLCIYKLYTREQMQKFRTGWYTVPYDQSFRVEDIRQNLLTDPEKFEEAYNKAMDPYAMKLQNTKDLNYFQERFDIDFENGYENIDVPDFKGGRQGRFIHDFNINKTGIVDVDGNCCFVMQLNRKIVLPPISIIDLLNKMINGYYDVDTEVVRETMRITFPAITNYSSVGPYIARECRNMPTYLLQPVNEKVKKRSPSSVGVYSEAAGKKILQIEIMNFNSVLKNNEKK